MTPEAQRLSPSDVITNTNVDTAVGQCCIVPAVDKDDSPGAPQDTYRANWYERFLLDTWVPETIAISISTCCLVAIVSILLVFNGRTLPHLPYGITLNAIISILATTSRSMLVYVVAASISQLKWCWLKKARKVQDIQIFDDASRGPWGSLTLLFSLKARPLASLGAVITILALGLDPFVQQILTYRERIVKGPEAAPPLSRALDFNINPLSDEWVNAIQMGIFS